MSSFLYGYQNKIIILFTAFEILASTNKIQKNMREW